MTDGSQRREQQRPYPNMTTVFAPGVFRRADARVFELRGDDEITDADLKIDSSGLYTIRGRIVAGDDHHAPNAAMLTLYDQGNDDPRHLAASLEDGTFQIDYVPSGRYTLRVNLAADEATPEAGRIFQVLRRYKMASFDVVIAEHDVVLGDLPLAVLKPGEKEEYPF